MSCRDPVGKRGPGQGFNIFGLKHKEPPSDYAQVSEELQHLGLFQCVPSRRIAKNMRPCVTVADFHSCYSLFDCACNYPKRRQALMFRLDATPTCQTAGGPKATASPLRLCLVVTVNKLFHFGLKRQPAALRVPDSGFGLKGPQWHQINHQSWGLYSKARGCWRSASDDNSSHNGMKGIKHERTLTYAQQEFR